MTGKKQALVTGANKGIGFAIAKGLAEQGMTVWMGARDPDRGEKAVTQLRSDAWMSGYSLSMSLTTQV